MPDAALPLLLQSGAEYFPALIAAIDAAESQVWLETYIFAADQTGLRVAQALARAARRGVSTRVLIDGFGTRTVPAAVASVLQDAGVEVRIYGPVPTWYFSLDRRHLRRLHRKLACVDARIAFVGGINILDDLNDPNHGPLSHPRLDYAVQVQDGLASAVHEEMARLWDRVISPERRELISRLQARLLPRTPAALSRVRLVWRDSLGHRRDIERAYLRAIGQARREVLIATAYFFPGRRIRRALREAARRGVRVRLLLQGRVEYPLPHRAAQFLYDSLMAEGIEIVEYHLSFLHAKVAVIDDWATVGSSNIDPFSLLLAREANVVVQDAGFARQLRGRLLAAMSGGGRPVSRERQGQRAGWMRRARGWVAYRLLRLGVLVSGERRHY